MADAHESLPSTAAATPLSGVATPLLGATTQPTPSTIQPIVMQLSVQDTPSVSGPPLISIPSAAPMAGPLINMSMAATQTAATQPSATQLAATQLAAPTATPLLSTMSVRPDQMGYFIGAPNFYPQSNQFPYMANLSWEASQREQFLQNQLLQECQQFEAWKARQAQPQPQPQIMQGQAPPLVPLEPTVMVKAPDKDVKIISVRSSSAKRAGPRDQASTNVPKRARSSASTSCRYLSPRRDYPRGTDTAMKPAQASPSCAEDRPVHAQDLEVFKADMTSMLADMLNSSLAKFASQLKFGSEGQGDSEPTQNVPSVHEKGPSDHDDLSEGRDFASVEELSEAPGDPQLENLMMTEEEQRDFETFPLASPNARRGKTSWKASQENTKFYSQAQQARPCSESFASQARSLGSVDQGQG